MHKVSLVGELNDIMRDLNDSLSEKFKVQLCSARLDSLQGLLKIISPNLIVVNQIGIEEDGYSLLDFLKENYSWIPVVAIDIKEQAFRYEAYIKNPQFAVAYRPTTHGELLDICYKMLGIQKTLSVRTNKPGRKQIMIVDDSAIMLRNFKSLLEIKYDVKIATSGELAIKMMKKEKPDLVLLDYQMPGLDGKAKMSKSLGNCIYLSDEPEDIKKKIMSMFTDPNHLRVEDPGETENNPVFIYLDAFSKPEHFKEFLPDYANLEELKAHYQRGGLGDVKVKKFLNNVIQTELKPIRERRKEWEQKIPEVYEILKAGSEEAKQVAQQTLHDVRKAMKINYFE